MAASIRVLSAPVVSAAALSGRAVESGSGGPGGERSVRGAGLGRRFGAGAPGQAEGGDQRERPQGITSHWSVPPEPET